MSGVKSMNSQPITRITSGSKLRRSRSASRAVCRNCSSASAWGWSKARGWIDTFRPRRNASVAVSVSRFTLLP
jgi:hypothetical protein